MKNSVSISRNFKIIFLVSILFLLNNLSYSQNYGERKLTKEERKLAKEKGLEQIQMKALLEKGYSFEKIENTPVDELQKESGLYKADIQKMYSDCNQERNFLRQREKELQDEKKQLKEHIAELKKRNEELEKLIEDLNKKLEEANK